MHNKNPIKNRGSSLEGEYFNELGISSTDLGKMPKLIEISVNCGLCPIIVGSTGCGKTEVVKQFTQKINAVLLHFYLSHIGVEELRGLMFRSSPTELSYSILSNKEIMQAFETCKKENRPLVFFLDELTRTDIDVLNTVFSMISRRALPGIEFPENVYLIAAANPAVGAFEVGEIKDPAFMRRLTWFGVKVAPGPWLKWAKKKNLHKKVIDHISGNPEHLYIADAHEGAIVPTPSRWEEISRVVYLLEKEKKVNIYILRKMLEGMVGQLIAAAFIETYLNGELNLPPEDLLHNWWRDTKKVLDRIRNENRQDLAAGLVKSLVGHLVAEMPILGKKEICNIVDFLLWLEKDLVAEFSRQMVLEQEPEWLLYKKELMFRLQKDSRLVNLLKELQQLRLG